MFYYLLHNSSFIKKGELKERLISTLIYGSVIYIIIHALLSFTNKKELITYFWFLFILDCIIFIVSNDWKFYTTTLNNIDVKPKKIKKIIEQEVSDIETETEIESDYIKEENEKTKKKKNKVRFNESKNEIKKFKKEEPIKKVKKNKKNNIKSTDIKSIIKKNNSDNENDNLNINDLSELPVDELNLTLENLELLENEKNSVSGVNSSGVNSSGVNSSGVNSVNSSSIDDIQRDFLKKKMEDEVSDPGSDIDLAQFEDSLING